jgi:kinesin family protein 6/9
LLTALLTLDFWGEKVVVSSLEGYNGTIFAYGQTGSGKTYTITGGTARYVDRGIIPRALSLIFSEIAQRSDYTYTVHFSYLEIYNETGYDLLDPDHETKALEDLPKVQRNSNHSKSILGNTSPNFGCC